MCRREATWLERRSKNGALVLEDISAPGFDAARFGKAQAELMGVMHGVFPDGRIVTKVAAFREALVDTVRNFFKKEYDAADIRQSIDAALVGLTMSLVADSFGLGTVMNDRDNPSLLTELERETYRLAPVMPRVMAALRGCFRRMPVLTMRA